LYSDFASEFIFLDLSGEKNGWRLNEKRIEMPSEIKDNIKNKYEKQYKEIVFVESGYDFNYNEQKFVSFQKDNSKKIYDLVFHCRSTTKLNTSYRNWETDKWNKLRDIFKDLKVACVGSKGESMAIDNTDDLRGISLEKLSEVLSGSRVIIGPSSGTMHFSSLCGCKHIVFTDKSIAFDGKYTNRYRYEVGWNPLNTKAIIIDEEGWRPSIDTVIKYVQKELS
jgi:ADP-heptose:LPS heptosyltransferase